MHSEAARGRALFSPYVLLIFVSLFWSGNAVVGRYAMDVLGLAPFTVAFWRWAIAFLILAAVAGRRALDQRALYLRHWRFVTLLALLSVMLFNVLQYSAFEWTTAVNTGIIGAALPVLIFVLTWATGQERASARQIAGLVAATAGVLVVVARGAPQVLLALELNFGDMLVLASALSWAVYSVLLRRLPGGLDPLGFLTVLVGIGLVSLVPFYLWDLARVGFAPLDGPTILVFLYVGIFPSVLAYIAWNLAVARVGANVSGMFINLIPILIAGLAIVFLGEAVRPFHLAGMALIFLGIYLATARGRKSA